MKIRTFRRILASVLVLTMVFSLSLTCAYADSSNVKVTVDGKAVTFNNDLGYPYIDNNGRTMVPFRAVANFMSGVKVGWNGDSREAAFFKSGSVMPQSGQGYQLQAMVHFPIDTNQAWGGYKWVSSYYYPNEPDNTLFWHRLVTMDTNAVIKNSRTYAPIRFLAEALGYDVGWNGNTRTVIITSPSGNWAGAVNKQQQQKGNNVVGSEPTAEKYVAEFMRMGYPGVKNYSMRYEMIDNIGPVKGYLFTVTSGSSSIKVLVSTSGGEWWYSNDGGLNYSRWIPF